MSIFTKRPQQAEMNSRHVAYQLLDNVKINEYTQFDPYIPCGSKVITFFYELTAAVQTIRFEVYDHFHYLLTDGQTDPHSDFSARLRAAQMKGLSGTYAYTMGVQYVMKTHS